MYTLWVSRYDRAPGLNDNRHEKIQNGYRSTFVICLLNCQSYTWLLYLFFKLFSFFSVGQFGVTIKTSIRRKRLWRVGRWLVIGAQFRYLKMSIMGMKVLEVSVQYHLKRINHCLLGEVVLFYWSIDRHMNEWVKQLSSNLAQIYPTKWPPFWLEYL